MSANPDLADIVVTYIKELWPVVDVIKNSEELLAEDGAWSIYVNSHVVGVVCYGVFATINFATKDVEFVKPTDPNFFGFVRHWTKLKAGLNDPTYVLPS